MHLNLPTVVAGILTLALGVESCEAQRSSSSSSSQPLGLTRSRLTRTTSTRTSTSTTSRRTTSTTLRTTTTPVRTLSVTTKTSTTTAAPTGTGAAGNGTWYKPKVGTTLLWSLDQAVPLGNNIQSNTGLKLSADVYGVDLYGTSLQQISDYHKQGKKVVCYLSAGSWESYRPDAKDFTPACYCNASNKCKMEGWPEYWLDIATPACLANIKGIMAKRIKLAKDKGCDAIEADNEDAYANETGWTISIDQQLDYLLFLSKTAHDLGVAMGLKNNPGLIKNRPIIVEETDFVLIEECAAYNECKAYQPYIDADKATWAVEYERSISCTIPGMQVTGYSSYQVDYKNIDAVCYKPK